MSGFVVKVECSGETPDFYNIVCDREADALTLVKAGFGLEGVPMRVLRPLAQWEITCFELEPLVAKRAPKVTLQPAPARAQGQR